MECVNPNTPEFKKTLEEVGGNPLLAEIEINKSFNDIEKVSNMIVNKLSIKNNPFFKRNREKIKDEYWYTNDTNIANNTAKELLHNIIGITYNYQNTVKDVYSNIRDILNDDLISFWREKLEKIQQWESRDSLDKLHADKRLIQDFSRRGLGSMSTYSDGDQSTIKKYLPSLFKENKYVSDKQGMYLATKNALKRIDNKIIQDTQVRKLHNIKKKAIIGKYETLLNLAEIDPDYKQRIEDRIINEIERRLKFKESEFMKNPNISNVLKFRALYNNAGFMTEQSRMSSKVENKEISDKINSLFDNMNYEAETGDVVAESWTVDFLNRIISQNSKYSDLAKYLLPYAEKHNVHISLINRPENTDAAGKTEIKLGQGINKKGEPYSYITDEDVLIDYTSVNYQVDPERLILHELVHTLSTIYIESEKYKNSQLGKANPLTVYMNYIKKVANQKQDRTGYSFFGDINAPYGFTNESEFVSEALTNPYFIEMLKSIPAMEVETFNNLFEELLAWIAKIFNINVHDNAYDQLYDIIHGIIDNQSEFDLYAETPIIGEEVSEFVALQAQLNPVQRDAKKLFFDEIYRKDLTPNDRQRINGILKRMSDSVGDTTWFLRMNNDKTGYYIAGYRNAPVTMESYYSPYVGILSEKRGLQKIGDTESSVASPETIKMIKDLLKRIGVDISSLQKIVVNGRKSDANGAALIMQKLIQVVEGKEAGTLPEEAMHFVVEIVKQVNPKLYKKLLSEINQYALLKQVFIDYGTDPDYQTKDGKPDVIKLKEEAIAKVLVETIINNAEGITEKPELLNKVRQSWWQSIIEFFKNLFSKSGFDRLSMDIITGKFTGTADDIKSERDITFLQKSKQEIAYDLLKEKASNIELRQRTDGTKDSDYFLRDTGKKIKNRVTNIVKDWYDNLFRNSKLLDTEFQKAVYDLKADTGTMGHSVMEYAFHLFVDEDGYLRDTPLEDSDYESKFTDDAGNIIFDRNKYEILKNNLKQRLESLDKDRTAGRTRFMAEIIIYDPNRDMAGTIDLIAISPKGKINMYDWKFMDIDTDKYSDVPWYKIKAWDKQMSQYKYILEKMYGMKSEDFQHTRMIPIQAVYSKPVYKKGQEKLPKLLSIKIGDVDIKNISDDYLLPVATKGERTGVEEIDALIDKLNMIYDTISERKITNEDEKKQKAQELNELFSAIRQLQIKQNVAPLINQAKLLNMMIENTITEYNTKYKADDVDVNSFSEDEIDNFEREIDESLEALYAYTDLDTDLRELFDLNKKEDKELYEGIKEVSNEARRLESRLKKIRKSYVADVVVKREGIDEHLKGEKVVKGVSKWFVTTTGIQTKAIQWLFRKASRALSFAAFDTQSESARLEKLRKEYIEWAKAKGLAIKDYFKILKKPDKNELINEFDNKFYKELEQKIAEKDFTWIRDNIDKVAYRDHLKELLEKELKRIEEKPRVSDDPDADILLEKQKARRLYTLSNTEAVGWLIYDQVKKFPRRDKWESKEWKELNKPENKPAKDFYNYILERNSEYKKLGYINNPRTFLPYVRKSLIDKFVTGGDITFGEHFFRSISIDEGDVGYGQIDANGRPINVIPKYFTREVDGEMSEDLFRTMAMYNEAAIRYKYFAQIENQIKGVLNVERNKQSIATSFFGKPKLKDGKIEYVEGNDDNSKILENLIKSIVYGQKYIESETFDQLLFKLGTWGEALNKKLGIKVFPEGLAERQVSMSKSIDTLNNIFQLNALGLNILSATSNLFGGTAQAVINAGTYFTKADYLSSELTMFLNKFNGTDKKKMIGALNYFLPLTENYNRQIAKKLSLSTLTQESLQDFLMVLMRQSDLNVQTTIFYAFLKNTIVINGELLNAREYLRSKPEYEEKYKGTREQRIAYEEEFENEVEKLIEEKGIMKVAQIVDGEFTIPGIDRKSKGVVDLRVKVRQLSGDALGNLTEENIRLINASVYGKSFMVFKNWIPRPVDVRVSSLKYNAAMDAYEWGRMRTIMRIIGEDLLNKTDYLYASLIGSEKGVDFMRQLYEKKKAEYAAETGKTLKMTEAQFIDLVRTNIRNQIYDVMFLTSMFLIVVGLKAAMPDDDGEDEAVMNQYRFIVKMADKFRTELSYFYDPTNLISLVSTGIFPSLSFVENFRKAIKNFLKENWALATGDTETAEDTYVIKYWMKTFPFTNQLAQYMPMFYPELAKDLGIRMQSNYSLIRK